MKKMRKLLSLLLCIIMVVSVTACGSTKDKEESSVASKSSQSAENKSSEAESSVEEERETITLTALNYQNVDSFPWFLEYVEEEFGIILESKMGNDSTVLQSLMASGELTDLVVLMSRDNIKTAVDGNMLLDLDQYADQLPDVMNSELYAPALERLRDSYGFLPGLPCTVGTKNGLSGNHVVRWDLYEDLGMPEVPDEDAWLEMLADMKELYPKTEDGKNTVGIGIWTDWDGKNVYAVKGYYMWHKGYIDKISAATEFYYDGSKGAPTSILADDSVYYQGLKFLRKAKQLGLIDPDVVSVKWQSITEQMASGSILWFYDDYSYLYNANEDAEDYSGYAPLYYGEEKAVFASDNALGDGTLLLGVSSKCEYPERAVEFLNWWYSDEGISMLINGPEGVVWEWKDGQRVYTDAYVEAYNKGEEYILPGGGTKNPYLIFNVLPVTQTNEDPSGDGCVDISLNPGAYGETEQTKLDAAWSKAHGGHQDMKSYMMATGTDENTVKESPVLQIIPAAPDEVVQILNQLGPVIVTASWEMIYAETDAEFDKIWKQLQEDAKDIGIDQVVEDAVSRYQEALELAKKYGLDV